MAIRIDGAEQPGRRNRKNLYGRGRNREVVVLVRFVNGIAGINIDDKPFVAGTERRDDDLLGSHDESAGSQRGVEGEGGQQQIRANRGITGQQDLLGPRTRGGGRAVVGDTPDDGGERARQPGGGVGHAEGKKIRIIREHRDNRVGGRVVAFIIHGPDLGHVIKDVGDRFDLNGAGSRRSVRQAEGVGPVPEPSRSDGPETGRVVGQILESEKLARGQIADANPVGERAGGRSNPAVRIAPCDGQSSAGNRIDRSDREIGDPEVRILGQNGKHTQGRRVIEFRRACGVVFEDIVVPVNRDRDQKSAHGVGGVGQREVQRAIARRASGQRAGTTGIEVTLAVEENDAEIGVHDDDSLVPRSGGGGGAAVGVGPPDDAADSGGE